MQGVVVVGHKTDEKHGYNAVQIGFRTAKEKHVNKPQIEMFKQIGIEPKREIREFRVSADAFPPIGAEITAQHFVPGEIFFLFCVSFAEFEKKVNW